MSYPTSIDTDSDLYLTKNQLSGILNGSLDASQTTVTMTSTTGFPAVGVVTVDSEVIKYTSTNSTQLLGCTRGFDGTGATTHSSGATVKHAVTAIHHNALKDSLIAVETDVANTVRRNMQNILINGGFEIWQRNTTFSSPAQNAYTADRWKMDLGGTPTYTISREATAANVDKGTASLKLEVTSVNGATTCRIQQDVENFLKFKGGTTLTATARIKTSASNVKIAIYDGFSFIESSAHTGSGNFETLTTTLTFNATPNACSIYAGFLQTTVNTGAVYIDSIMLTIGSTPVTFTPADESEELARCQRYYEKSSLLVQSSLIERFSSQNIVYIPMQFKVTKRTTPTITITKNTVFLVHSPLSGNGSSADTANWTPSAPSPEAEGIQYVAWTRSTDQTTFPLMELNWSWVASAEL